MGITTNDNKIATKDDCYIGLKSRYSLNRIPDWASDYSLPTRVEIETVKITGFPKARARITGNYAPNQCVMTKDITFVR